MKFSLMVMCGLLTNYRHGNHVLTYEHCVKILSKIAMHYQQYQQTGQRITFHCLCYVHKKCKCFYTSAFNCSHTSAFN